MSKTRKFDFRGGAHGPHFSKLAVAVSLVLGAMATPMAAPLQLTADQVFDWNGQTSATLDGIEANITPEIKQNQFPIQFLQNLLRYSGMKRFCAQCVF